MVIYKEEIGKTGEWFCRRHIYKYIENVCLHPQTHAIKFYNVGSSLQVEPAQLDFNYYLPVFFDGLREVRDPYGTIAELAVHSMLSLGGAKIPSVVPQLILPLKRTYCIIYRRYKGAKKNYVYNSVFIHGDYKGYIYSRGWEHFWLREP